MQPINSNSAFFALSPVPTNPQDLPLYLENQFLAIQTAITQLAQGHVDVTHVAPAKPREGDIRLCDGVNWNPLGTGQRFVGYRGGAWRDLG